MKLGIITDIHSNNIALSAILKEFEKIKIDKIICCGDIIGIGPNPEETVRELIKEKDKLIAVKGNHEQYLLEGLPEIVHNNERKMGLKEIQNHKWTHSKITKESKKFLEELPLYRNVKIGNKKIYIIHYPINRNGEYKKHVRNATVEEHEGLFAEIDSDIFIYGHTHVTCINNKDNKWYINVGSLGCPLKSNIAKAGILEIRENKLEFQDLKIEYNVDEVIKEIKKIKFPFYEKILKIFYEDR